MSTANLNPSERETYWLDHISQWRTSGKSRTAYCKQVGIKLSQFCYWINKREPNEPKPGTDFISVPTSGPANAAEFGLQLHDGRLLQWSGEVSPSYIIALCKGLSR